jgi:hypothetical protein
MAQNIATASAEKYRHESACPLMDPHTEVAEQFIEVFREVNRRLPDNVTADWGASGCGSCFHTDAAMGLYWVAQHDAVDKMYVGYRPGPVPASELGELVAEAAEAVGVGFSWTGDISDVMVLGDGEHYDD